MSVNIEGAKERFARCRKLERTHEDNQKMYNAWSSTYDEGFDTIDGLDANEKMMKCAREKNVYRKEFVEAVPEEGQTSIASDSYDVITVHGGFGSGALPVNALIEMFRIAKRGGHIVIATIPDYFEYPQYMNKLRPLMTTLENTKRWKKMKEESLDQFVVSTSGILFVYKKL